GSGRVADPRPVSPNLLPKNIAEAGAGSPQQNRRQRPRRVRGDRGPRLLDAIDAMVARRHTRGLREPELPTGGRRGPGPRGIMAYPRRQRFRSAEGTSGFMDADRRRPA